ncbi:hypothetical protein [Nitrosomonas sp. HPC101]|uniref:hypothetical protein n=1 Tax=Nitrosomonas sp. HPC101 TaxID=1658667 RepID=UPI001878EBD3|nr:hypothetical protein [Nitrosomonas sp. HPC101]
MKNNIPETKEWQDQVHNGDEFTGRLLPIGSIKPAEITNSTGCARLGIEHPMIKPRTPQTNDEVERLN